MAVTDVLCLQLTAQLMHYKELKCLSKHSHMIAEARQISVVLTMSLSVSCQRQINPPQQQILLRFNLPRLANACRLGVWKNSGDHMLSTGPTSLQVLLQSRLCQLWRAGAK